MKREGVVSDSLILGRPRLEEHRGFPAVSFTGSLKGYFGFTLKDK